MSETNFLNELRTQFDRLLKTKENLDKKATGMITMSGLVSALLMGFGTILLRSIDPSFKYFQCMLVVLLFGVLLMVITIILSVMAYKTRDQWYPLGSDKFYDKDFVPKAIDSYRKAEENIYNLRMIRDYIFSMNDTEKIIESKGKWLKVSQWAFLAGIGTISLIVLAIILAMIENKIIIQL